jgi:hypothetical protein
MQYRHRDFSLLLCRDAEVSGPLAGDIKLITSRGIQIMEDARLRPSDQRSYRAPPSRSGDTLPEDRREEGVKR